MARASAVLFALSVAVLVAAPAAAALPSGADGTLIIKRELIQESARISDLGQAAARAALERAFTEPITEADVVTALSAAMVENGSSEFVAGFEAIVASGADSAIPHGDPANDADNFILPGEVVVVDIGARFKGWVSDNTKTYFIGVQPPENFTTAYNLVYEAQALAIAGVRARVIGADLDAIARNYLADAGFGEYFVHCLGHGVGLYVHVPPLICTGSNDVLSAVRNDVVAIEPGLYFENCFGVRIEDDFAVMQTGSERYTHAPSEFSEILVAPPMDWNGTSPTGAFADYSGCSFKVNVEQAAGAPALRTSSTGGGLDGASMAAVGAVGAVVAVALWRRNDVRRLPQMLRGLSLPKLPVALRRR